MEENRAAVLYGPNDIRLETIPVPTINDDVSSVCNDSVDECDGKSMRPWTRKLEVLLRMECIGICGSDVKLYTTAKCAEDVLSKPVVLGHEGAGVVYRVGKNVTSLKIGDRVAVEPCTPCRVCEYCKMGRYNLCPQAKYCSMGGEPGNISTYYKHVADFCHRIPDNMSMEEGAALQPLSVAVHACSRAGVKIGTTVAILGAGPIGVLCAMTAKAMGATAVLLTDMIQNRLVIAKKLVADHTLLVTNDTKDEETVNKIIELLGGRPDVTIDACGAETAIRVALTVTKSGGVVLVVGIGEKIATLPLSPALLREVDVRGSIRINNVYPTAVAMVCTGAINLKSIITHHFKMDEVQNALDAARNRLPMKAIVHV